MVKVNIISGFLGAGKTTLIKKMIQEAYKGEKLVLIENEFGEIGIDGGFLQDAGIEITNISANFDQAEFERIIPEFDALIIGAHDFSEADMERCPKLKIICKHGVGLDNIHVNKAKELGIEAHGYVCDVTDEDAVNALVAQIEKEVADAIAAQ